MRAWAPAVTWRTTAVLLRKAARTWSCTARLPGARAGSTPAVATGARRPPVRRHSEADTKSWFEATYDDIDRGNASGSPWGPATDCTVSVVLIGAWTTIIAVDNTVA